ncbi:hypothetical protein JQF37_01760 [Pseudomonas sp. MIL9]|uniref:hypothetical protein n=1 Tax=Pseudomonas sp. MIL9 TaxID=2807620 RepID=UPI0019515D37|nr:hypothetical protein [Pseudomonas sp. MIL9]MBM6442354.1 hypothetical protein [Pseudomonas sp. MIL9]
MNYISNDLNMVKALDPDRHALALKMEAFLSKGGTIEVIGICRSLFSPIPFNSEVFSGSPNVAQPKRDLSAKIKKSAKGEAEEAAIAEKLKAYHDKGVVAAAKDLHISTRRANHIAAQYGIKFACRVSLAARQEDLALVPQIRALIIEGLTQDQMCARLHIGRTTLKRVAGQNGLKFRSQADHSKDLVLVERIKAIRDIGCTRAACARQLDINPKVLLRLIAEHEIDFPVRTPGVA